MTMPRRETLNWTVAYPSLNLSVSSCVRSVRMMFSVRTQSSLTFVRRMFLPWTYWISNSSIVPVSNGTSNVCVGVVPLIMISHIVTLSSILWEPCKLDFYILWGNHIAMELNPAVTLCHRKHSAIIPHFLGAICR